VPWKLILTQTGNWVAADRDSGNAGKTVVHFTALQNETNTNRSVSVAFTSPGVLTAPVTLTVAQSYEVQITHFTDRAPGGSNISIYGSGFAILAEYNIVTINGKVAQVLSANETELTVIVPLGAGTGPIIINADGRKDTSEYDFVYVWVGATTLFAGSSQGFSDGTGKAAQFTLPMGLDFDANGNLYVADYGNYRIRKITPQGMVSTFAGSIPGQNDGTGTNAQLNLVSDLVLDKLGNIYAVDYNDNSVRKITPAGVVTTLAGGDINGGNDDGTGAAAKFTRPRSIAIDSEGNLYVTDSENHRVRKITPLGVVTTFVGNYNGYADDYGSYSLFKYPFGIEADRSGNLFVADLYNDRIRKVDLSNKLVITFAGNGDFWDTDGFRTDVGIGKPLSIAIDSLGNMYIGTENGKIRWISPDGNLRTIENLDENGEEIKFYRLDGLAVDKNGVLYVSDTHNHKIYKVVIQ
jgi:sugar lactone lactonase YvrE